MPKSRPAARQPATEPRRSRVLIADDNEPNRELLEVYLADIDCEIATAIDGRDTLDKVASFRPDVILLDVMMPKLSGFERKSSVPASTARSMSPSSPSAVTIRIMIGLVAGSPLSR